MAGHQFRTPDLASDPEGRKRESKPIEDGVFGRRPSTRSGLRHSPVALGATVPALTLCQSCDFPALLRQRDPEGLSETRWPKNRPGGEWSARQLGLAYISAYLSVPARRDGSTHRSPAETNAACAGIDHHGRIWQRADGFQARGQQQSGKPTAQISKEPQPLR